MIRTNVKRRFIFFSIVFIALGFIYSASPLSILRNCYSLAANRGYFIPTESNIWIFKSIKDNEGSGEYWLFGEDLKNYYKYSENQEFGHYHWISKENTSKCMSFNSLDPKTWCKEFTNIGR